MNDIKKNNNSLIGQSIPRIDSPAKVTGKAQYAGDIILPGTLHGKLLKSTMAHAKIISIDVSAALAFPGVKDVIIGKDTPCIKFGNWRLFPNTQDELPLAVDKVRFIGDEIAAVAAITPEIAEEALTLIKVEYEELPAVFNIDDSLALGAPLIHDENKELTSNISLDRKIDVGDIEQAFKDADYVREDSFLVHPHSHAYMEPCATIAETDAEGRVTIYTSTQTPYIVQCLLASTLGIPENHVRVIKPAIGGGFGGKMELRTWEFCAAFMSRRTGRPVRFVLNRQEEFEIGRRRHGMKIKSKVGFKKDGTIVAKDFEAYLDGGAYNSMGPTATFLCGNFGAMLYRYPVYRYRGYHVYTNLPPSGAMRGFGAPQAMFISETQMNMAAIDLGIDAIDLRIKNAMVTGDKIEGVTTISSAGFVESLEKIASATSWKEKKKNLPPNKGIGIGCYSFISGGVFNWFNTQYHFSACEIRAYDDGTAHLFTMSCDIGQGSDTVLRQIMAADLGLSVNMIRLTAGDTAMTPKGDLGTWGSRVTLMNGNAILDATKKIKNELAKMVSIKFNLNVIHDVAFGDGKVFAKANPKYGMTFGEAVTMWVKMNRGEELTARGVYTPRDKGLTTPAYSFGAQVAEVDVDPDTGVVTVERISTAHDCGTVINPLAVEGQLEGAIQMGLGYTLCEQFAMKDGKTLNANFLDYKVPSAEDMPKIVSYKVDTYEKEGPFGAKEVGEGLVIPTAPAIADAVFQATGYRCKDLPITPEKILRATRKI